MTLKRRSMTLPTKSVPSGRRNFLDFEIDYPMWKSIQSCPTTPNFIDPERSFVVNHSLDIFEGHWTSVNQRVLYFNVFTIKNLIDVGTLLYHSKERSLGYKTSYSESLSILVCEAGMNYNTKYSQNRSRFFCGFRVVVAPILECPRRTLAYLVEREKGYLPV